MLHSTPRRSHDNVLLSLSKPQPQLPPRTLRRAHNPRALWPKGRKAHLHPVAQHRPPQLLKVVLYALEQSGARGAHPPREEEERRVEHPAEV